MKKTISILAIAGLVLALAPAAQAATDFEDDAPASYRLMFITSTTRDATDTAILEYNKFVQAEADLSSVVLNGVAVNSITWNAVGSTLLVAARDNTGTNPNTDGTGVAIYDTLGNLLVANNAALWGTDKVGNTLTVLKLDGTAANAKPITGTLLDGTQSLPANGDGGVLGNLVGGGNVKFGGQRGGATESWIESN
jgi:hypothetical protein